MNKGSLENWEGQHRHPALFCIPAIIRYLGYNPLPAAKTLAGRLTRYRVSLGITQKELAKQLGIDPCTLARWERGDRTPTGLYRKLVDDLLNEISRSQTPTRQF